MVHLAASTIPHRRAMISGVHAGMRERRRKIWFRCGEATFAEDFLTLRPRLIGG
jgi:hypothetical protein